MNIFFTLSDQTHIYIYIYPTKKKYLWWQLFLVRSVSLWSEEVKSRRVCLKFQSRQVMKDDFLIFNPNHRCGQKLICLTDVAQKFITKEWKVVLVHSKLICERYLQLHGNNNKYYRNWLCVRPSIYLTCWKTSSVGLLSLSITIAVFSSVSRNVTLNEDLY